MNNEKLAMLWIEVNGDVVQNIAHVCTCDEPDKVTRTSLDRLDPQYVYLTNQRSHIFTRNKEIAKHYTMYHSQYFGVSVSQVAIELNLTDDLHTKLPVLLKIFSSIYDKLEKMNVPHNPREQSWSYINRLNRAFIPQTKNYLMGATSDSLDYAIENSTQKLQSNNLRKGENEQIVSARMPKTPHFLHLTDQVYPASNHYKEYDEFDGEVCGTEGGDVINETVIEKLVSRSETNAGFVHFQVLAVDKLHKTSMPIGMEMGTTVVRCWATLPEVIDMMNFTKLKLGTAYLTEGGRLAAVPEQPPKDTIFTSYTNSLINEIFGLSLGYSQKDREPSPIAAYYRAYDRIYCRIATKELITEGFRLSGFSSGTVRFYIDKKDKRRQAKLTKAFISNDLIPQLSML